MNDLRTTLLNAKFTHQEYETTFRLNTMMKINKKLLIRLSVALNIILLIVILFVMYKFKAKTYGKEELYQTYKIIMFGNSITEEGNWSLELNRFDVKNSGKSGFTSSHFVLILDNEVLKYNPKICFIEGSINDIILGIPLERMYKNYESIIDTLIKNKIEPVLQSTLYVNQPKDSASNSKIENLNSFLSNLASKKNITFLDLNQFYSKNKKLKKEYTTDGIHIKKSAYKIWAYEIDKILKLKGI